ncbi:PRD domain-containing protein [Nocardioides zhouii]|uniref:PRD domain-containing protein n=1 Tax=Nocardioides zhouii TaxID=1168729 RepID=A0A4Q2SKD3_9ACTN|nr:PRD domain-containing protein [Nocardioides zhouii]RYC05922.1 PRD domain-containing protein [Nocardioides zhouii]
MSEETGADPAVLARVAEEFADRLDMLQDSDQVTMLARRLTELSLADLATALGLTFTEDDSAQFVTHLAIALTRINRGEVPIEPSLVAEEEIAERTREREAVTRVMGDCGRLLDRDVPESEISYMVVHLCGIVDVQSPSA